MILEVQSMSRVGAYNAYWYKIEGDGQECSQGCDRRKGFRCIFIMYYLNIG